MVMSHQSHPIPAVTCTKAATTSTIQPPCGGSIGLLAMVPVTATAEANERGQKAAFERRNGAPLRGFDWENLGLCFVNRQA